MEFSAIIDKPIHEMDGRDLNNFQYFLSGLQIPKSNYEFYTTKNANLETSKSIIKRCQDYMKYCGYKNYNLLISRNINRISNSKNLDCPKFISIKEFNSIIKYIMNDESLSKVEKLKYECIYTLMFDSGLRIGEVLGLTLEDFEPIYSDKGKLFYKVIIRNRLSDNKNQHAKRCCNVLDRKIYMSSNYHKKNIGYQIAYIKEELYEKIIDYFDMNFNYFINQKKNYPIADSVNNDIKNYYIFTNKTKATCLSLFMIYKYTRKMFLDIGIQIDYLKNKNNLLHRFRHGYAMKLLYLYKLDPFEVIHYTRHVSVRSLEAYNNPTDEQLTSILERVEEI